MKETIKTYQNWNDTNDLIFKGVTNTDDPVISLWPTD